MEANRPAAHLDAYMRQLAVEALIPLGAHDLALSELGKAVDSPSFVDADWIERCQALDPIRDREEVARMISRSVAGPTRSGESARSRRDRFSTPGELGRTLL